MTTWFDITGQEFVGVLISVVMVYGGIIALTRVIGLRSFSKMSASDFAITIAVGSIFGAAVTNPNPSVSVAVLALAGLFVAQWLIAFLRTRTGFAQAVDNAPLMLVRDGELLEQNMKSANVTQGDIRAKLREANVFRLQDAAAVIFETTGDISVLHSKDRVETDDFILNDVVR